MRNHIIKWKRNEGSIENADNTNIKELERWWMQWKDEVKYTTESMKRKNIYWNKKRKQNRKQGLLSNKTLD